MMCRRMNRQHFLKPLALSSKLFKLTGYYNAVANH